jgi:hypothetical protein
MSEKRLWKPRMAAGQRVTTVLMIFVVLVAGRPAWAQSATEGHPLLASAHRASERLARAEALQPSPVGSPGGNWIVRHPVVAGTAIGAGAGLAVSRVDAIGGRGHDPRVSLIGAGAGAWGGLIVSAVQHVRAGKRVGTGTTIGIVAGAVGLVVLPALACYGAGGCGGSS